MIIEPDPQWEYEQMARPPNDFQFIIDRLYINGTLAYHLNVNDIPYFEATGVQAFHGDWIDLTVDLAAWGIG